MSDQEEPETEKQSPHVLVKPPEGIGTMSREEVRAWVASIYPDLKKALQLPPQDD